MAGEFFPLALSLWAATAPAQPVYTPVNGTTQPFGERSMGTTQPELQLSVTDFSGTHINLTEPERFRKTVEYIRERGPFALRLFGYVPNAGMWANRYIPPAQVPSALEAAMKTAGEMGLRSCPVIIGDAYGTSQDERRRMVNDSVLNMVGHEECVLYWEIANEGGHTGFSGDAGVQELYELGRTVKSLAPRNFLALTSAEDYDGAQPGVVGPDFVYNRSGCPADFFSFHPERNDGGGQEPCRPTRVPYAYNFFGIPKRGACSEPRGPVSSIIQTSDPLDINADALLTWMEGFAVYNYHPGGQVYQIPYQYSLGFRYGNLWDDPYSDGIMRNLAALRAALPQDLCDWDRKIHADPKFNGTFPFVTEVDKQWDAAFKAHGTRAYCTWQGNRFIIAVLCQKDAIELTAPVNMTFRVRNILDYSIVQDYTLGSGQSMALPLSARNVIIEGEWL